MPYDGRPQFPGTTRSAYLRANDETGRAGYHGNLLRFVREINNIAHLSQLPTVLTAAAFADSPEQQRDVIRALRALQVLSGAPLAMEATRAGAQVINRAPDKRMAAQELIRPVGTEALMQLLPYIQTMASALS